MTHRKLRMYASVLTALAAPVAALAAEAGHGGEAKGDVMVFDYVQFIMAILVFGIVLVIARAQVWPKILGGLEAREGKIRSEVYAAEELRKTAAKEKAEFERALSDAKAEALRMIEATKAEQMRLAADLRLKAEKELTDLRDQARTQIEAAKRAAVNEIYEHAANLATSVAGKILQREVNQDDQRRLVEESIGQFERDLTRV